MNPLPKALAAAAFVAAMLLSVSVAPAAAATPCWKTLLNDWYDGRIDNIYPVHCYQDALRHLPQDISVYSSAKDDILRALQSAKEQLQKNQVNVNGNTPVPAETTPNTSTVTTNSTPTTRTRTTTTGSAGPGGTDAGGGNNSTTSPGRKPGKGLPGVAQQLNPSSPSSVPVPLLVLGGLALLLVAAGAGGLVLKRVQQRRPDS